MRRSHLLLSAFLGGALANPAHPDSDSELDYALPPTRLPSPPSLLPRDEPYCRVGTLCGKTCTLGQCCSTDLSLSCRPTLFCVTIGNVIGCCATETGCNSVRTCLSANDTRCREGTQDANQSCCDSETPVCDSENGVPFCRAGDTLGGGQGGNTTTAVLPAPTSSEDVRPTTDSATFPTEKLGGNSTNITTTASQTVVVPTSIETSIGSDPVQGIANSEKASTSAFLIGLLGAVVLGIVY